MRSLIIRLFILIGLFFPALASADTAVEFYKADINHYFMTASIDEAASLDSKPDWGWVRTGKTFNVWLIQASAPSNASPVCRFYGLFANGTVGSHFYTVDTTECDYVKGRLDWGWGYEGDAFYAVKPTGGSCPSGTSPVYRAYNNGMGGAPNHRYMTSQTDVDTMVSQGWVSESAAMCASGKSSGINSAMGGIVADTSGASVTVPPDALMSVYANVAITSTPLPTGTPLPVSLQGSVTSVSKQYTLSQDSGFNFAVPVTVTIPYDTTGLTANDVIAAAYYDTVLGKWVPISNGVDSRAAGTFTFNTTHFSTWTAVRVHLSLSPSNCDTHFDPSVDGLPIANFGIAVNPDGTTPFSDGNCAGMAGLSGWYYKNKKQSDGPAATRFTDTSALRNYIAMLHSGWNADVVNSLSIMHNVTDSLWSPRTALYNTAADAIRKKLYGNQSPVLTYITDGASLKHYVLIYKYDASGSFYYYDPNDLNYSQSPKPIPHHFNSNTDGTVTDWWSGGLAVTQFMLSGALDEHFTTAELELYYSAFNSNITWGVWGQIDNLQATLPTSDSIKIMGSVTTDTHLAGKTLYMHFYAPANRLVTAQNQPPSNMVEIFPDQQLSITSNWSALPVGVFGDPAAFAASFPTSMFTLGTPVTLILKVSTKPQDATTGLWANGEVTLPQISTTSLPTCTLPQVLTNGVCVTPTQPTITTTSLPSATVNTGYAQGMAVSGGQTPYTWSVSSGLPGGLNINPTTGVISGTPTASGTFAFSVTVTDSSSPQKTTSKPLSLTVSNPVALTPTVSYVTPSTIAQGTGSQSATITGSNFTSSSYHQYSVSGGGSWAWATVAPTINSPTSMTISVANTALQTMSYRVCATYGDISTCSGIVTVTVQAANVAYSLSLGTSGTGSGTISYTGGYVCPSSCSQNYNSGATITLTANANAGSTFAGWSGGACFGTGSCTVTMSAAKSVTATFSANSVAVNGACGSSLNGTFATAPTANLCNVGAPSAVSTGTPWSWSCSGSSGGTTASCWAFPVATATPPGLPSNLTSSAASSSQINLSWNASTAGSNAVAGYSIERCMGSGCSNYATLTSTASTNYSDTGLSGGTFYAYRLRAYDNAGNYSNPTGSVSAITPASVSVPVAAPVPSCNISPATATILTGASQIFSASCTNSPTAYQWRVDGNLWSVGGAGPTSSDTFSGLAAGSHTVSVTAFNASGSGSPVSVTLIVSSVAVPSCNISPASANIVSGTTQVFTANCTNSPTNYQWLLDGTLVGSGSINIFGTGTGLAVGSHTLTVTALNAGGSSVASSASLTVATVAVSLPAGYVSQGGLTWMPVSASGYDWPSANFNCPNSMFNGQFGWRLPTKDELVSLYNSGAMNGQGWTLWGTISSTPAGAGSHYGVGLNDGSIYVQPDANGGVMACVR